MLKTEAVAGAGQKKENTQTALIGPKKEPGSPTLLPAGERESRKAAALINAPLHNVTTDLTRKEGGSGPDQLGETDQVALMEIGTNGQPSPHPRMLHLGKRTGPLIDEDHTAPQGNAVLLLATETLITHQLVPQTEHPNRAILLPEQDPPQGEAAAARQTTEGEMLTGRTHR